MMTIMEKEEDDDGDDDGEEKEGNWGKIKYI